MAVHPHPEGNSEEILGARLAIDRAVFADLCRGVALKDALAILCRAVEQQSPGLLCTVLILDRTGTELLHGASPSLPEGFTREIDHIPVGPRAGSCGTAAYRHEPVIVSDIATDPLWADVRDLALKNGLRACWSTPVFSSQGRMLGTFALYYREARVPSERERQLVKWATPLVAITVERQQAEDSIREQQAELEMILDSAPAMIWYKDKDNRVLRVNRAAASFLGLARHEVEGRSAYELFPLEAAKQQHLEDLEVIQSGEPRMGTRQMIRKASGDVLWVIADRVPYLDPEGKILGVIVFARDVTEQQTAETALRDAEVRYRLLVERIPAVIYIAEYGAEGAWTYVSPQIKDLLGFTPEQWMADPMSWAKRLHPKDKDRVVEMERACEAKGEGFVSEYRLFTREGKVVWVRDEASILPAEPGRKRLMQGVLLDITESKTTQLALRSAEERLVATLNNAPVILYALDEKGVFTLSEGKGLEGLHLKPGEVVGKSMFELYRNYPNILANLRRALAGEEFTSRGELPDLHLTYEVAWSPQKDASGRVIGVTGVATDISARKRAEDAHLESEERYRTVAETATDGLVTVDQDSEILFANPSMERIFGYSAKELIGQPLTLLMPHESRAAHLHALRHYVETGERSMSWDGVEFVGLHKSGRRIALEVSLGESSIGGGRTFTGIVRDITQRKLAEEALRQSEEKYARMVQASPDPITLRDLADGRYLDVNESFTRVTGYSRDEVVGRTTEELKLVLNHHWYEDLLNDSQDKPIQDRDFSYQTKAGEIRHGKVSATRVRLGDKECLLSIARDITEHKRAEEALRKSEMQLQVMQKMDAVGRLAGGIAHDFNNLLMIVSGQLELLQMHLGQSENAEAIRHAQKATDRATSLTRQLLAFSRMQALRPQIINLNTVVHDMRKLIAPLIGPNIYLDLQLELSLATVKADPGQIEQVILNLVVNSRDAMPGGGRLTLKTANAEVSAGDGRDPLPLPAGSYVMLEVSDSGIGMDAETQSHVFEPFFTTKERERGTGLGLASVYGVVKQSGGYISVESAVGEGTTFRIHLPKAEAPAESHKPVEATVQPPRGSETVLLVEDENEVRDIARQFLERLGYRVLEARNSKEAIAIAQKHHDPIHVLLTDVVMPGISGQELGTKVTAVRPEIRVVYMSGYSETHVPGSQPAGEDIPLLLKPFTRDALARTLRKALDRK